MFSELFSNKFCMDTRCVKINIFLVGIILTIIPSSILFVLLIRALKLKDDFFYAAIIFVSFLFYVFSFFLFSQFRKWIYKKQEIYMIQNRVVDDIIYNL